MKKIVIEVIPASEQRYETVGDWFLSRYLANGMQSQVDSWDEADTLHVKVSKMNDPRHEDLVILHELAEALMCRHKGISPADVDRFDKEWEADHSDGKASEPGQEPDAPYYRQHLLAMAIENMVAGELEINHDDYDCDLDEAWKRSGHGGI